MSITENKAKRHRSITIVGAQWGDEGKGKFVDIFAQDADVVVRYNGGPNAGHTVVVEGVPFHLHALPSGTIPNPLRTKHTMNYVGNGCVVDPQGFLAELDALAAKGVELGPEDVKVAANAPLILPLHRELEALREGQHKIGTTGRGIGPAYEDLTGRRAVRAIDLVGLQHPEKYAMLEQVVDKLLDHHNILRKGFEHDPVQRAELLKYLSDVSVRFAPYVAEVWQALHQHAAAGDRIIFEGGQGVLLDKDFGTYPYVTSSTTSAAGVGAGTGFIPGADNFVLGIAKAYVTRVGSGPFPTGLGRTSEAAIGEHLAAVGHEFGVTTGRKRDTGWLDLVALRQAVQVSGINGLAISKFDVMDGLVEVKVATAYLIDGKEVSSIPTNLSMLETAALTPVYKVFKGWQTSKGINDYAKLPKEMVDYIDFVEKFVGVPVIIVSTGPGREARIIRQNPFA